MQAVSFKHSSAHKASIIALYRSLIRHVNELSVLMIRPSICEYSKDIEKEIFKANIDHKLYSQQFKAELLYIIREEFRYMNYDNKIEPNRLRERLVKGIELEAVLQSALYSDITGVELISKLVQYRQQKLREQSWRAEYLKDPKGINESKNKGKPTLLKKQIESRSYNSQSQVQRLSILSQKEKFDRIKKELLNSDQNSKKLLRRYLKKLQTNHEIPIPHLLSYTPESAILPVNETISTSLAIPGSTCNSAIAHAYDVEYIDAIVKPEIEFDINKFHYLEHLNSIVNEKGPFKVQIDLTEAGPIAVPYIRMPYPRLSQLKEVALDIKKMMRLVRLKTVWNSSGNDISITEPRFPDGSYSVRGSKGFGSDERIYPKIHYDELAIGEGLWEYLIDKAHNNGKNSISLYVNEWLNALDVATNAITKELNTYYQKYNTLKSSKSPLLKEQQILQQQMNLHYDGQLKRYKSIIELLENNKVFKHSEIVNLDRATKPYDRYLMESNSRRDKKDFNGIPNLERIGMGKSLGDYLDDVGYHYFKLGMKFDKKLKF